MTPPAGEELRPIALAGFMGAGKTAVGRALAGLLERPFFDSDPIVVERLGAPIAELFASGREAQFRACERDVIAELVASVPPPVIALGGGALGDESTRRRLAEHAHVVYLRQPWEAVAAQLATLRRGRPLLERASDDEVQALFRAREAVYEACELAVDVDRSGVGQAATAVREALRRHGALGPPGRVSGSPLP